MPVNEREQHHVGLCATCAFMRAVPSSRGMTFYLCERARLDARFPKYPTLPVIRCIGYSAAPAAVSSQG